MLQFMGSKRVGHDSAAEQKQQFYVKAITIYPRA